MDSVLKKVNLYLNESDVLPIKTPSESILVAIVETLDSMGIVLSKEQQKTLLLNVSSIEV